ncbi:MAG: hypothetical protein QOF84_5787 [Streptomyces sp.]|jgi:hypothetical protein|nr:hypothetical protein [Streptomyces sp.]
MTAPSNPVVSALVDTVNNGDRAAFMDLLASDAVLTDDGSRRALEDWIDREIFTANGRMAVQGEDPDGLNLTVRFHNDTWGDMNTRWHFEVAGGRISRIDTGQA